MTLLAAGVVSRFIRSYGKKKHTGLSCEPYVVRISVGMWATIKCSQSVGWCVCRDDQRCGGKYGKYWVAYQAHVPYRVIPGIF
jgi:hypothetical protein